MKLSIRFLIIGAMVAGCAAGQPSITDAQNFKLQGRTQGHCKLTNVKAGKELYNGTCVIKESMEKNSHRYSIKMGNTDPFLFATGDGVNWMHGPEKVRFRDRGHTGIFRWGDFRLEVDDD